MGMLGRVIVTCPALTKFRPALYGLENVGIQQQSKEKIKGYINTLPIVLKSLYSVIGIGGYPLFKDISHALRFS